MGGWSKVNPTTPIEKNDVNYNEIYQALYTHPEFGRMAVTIEYTSDSRRQFELHYPNICHEIRGDQVIEFPSRNLVLPDGRSVEAAIMSWQQPHDGNEALTAYWYVTRQGRHDRYGEIEMGPGIGGPAKATQRSGNGPASIRFTGQFCPDRNAKHA